MDLFWKAIAAALLIIVLGVTLEKSEKCFVVLLSISGCLVVCLVAFKYIMPVLEFFNEIKEIGNLNPDILGILVKVTGICLVSEVAAVICSDSGNSGLGKLIQLLGTTVILCMSVPVFRSLIDLIQKILGGL